MQRAVNLLKPLARSGAVAARRGFIGPPAPWRSGRSLLEEVQRRFDEMEREFVGAPLNLWRSFAPLQTVFNSPTFELRDPIVEEDGVKKYKLSFDVSRFKPEDVKVTTDSKEKTLTIDVKYKDARSSFDYSRTVSIPEGVNPSEITAKYTADGVLTFEAPYTAPELPEPPKEKPIEITHN